MEKNSCDINEIKRLIPHRYPFLLIDKVVDIQANVEAIGIKNVTVNEPYFEGHFPISPVVPGVLQVESLAQTAAVLVIKSLDLENALLENLKCYLYSNPFLLKSEIEKILINNNYNQKLNKEVEIGNNDIGSIRSRIFKLKTKNFDVREIYKLTKKEAEIKKFNFLIY